MICLEEERRNWECVATITVAYREILLRPEAKERGQWSRRLNHKKLLFFLVFAL